MVRLLPSMEVLPALVLALSPGTVTPNPVQVTGTTSHTFLLEKEKMLSSTKLQHIEFTRRSCITSSRHFTLKILSNRFSICKSFMYTHAAIAILK